MTRITRRTLLAATLPFATGAAFAQDKYPSRPINLIVPFAPGGSTDLLARLLRKYAIQHLGQDLIVLNKPGAGGAHGRPDRCDRGDAGGVFLASRSRQAARAGGVRREALQRAAVPRRPHGRRERLARGVAELERHRGTEEPAAGDPQPPGR